jgi:hypothetical protein
MVTREQIGATVGLAIFGLLLSGCAPPPPIVAGYNANFGTYPRFEDYVRARFPVGTDATAMEQDLRAQGFMIVSEGDRARSATYHYDRYCLQIITLRWRADQRGSVESSSGHMNHCPFL